MEDLLKSYVLSQETYYQIRDTISQELSLGLSKSCERSSIKMLISYVQNLPTGREIGEFLALDLGGSNFRVLLIHLNGSPSAFRMESKIYPLTDSIKASVAVELFDYIVDCVDDFLKTVKISHYPVPLGFTFSFPVIQSGLASGRLVQWTKEITCDGVVGEDVVRLLHEAIQRKKTLQVECVALVNDTVGCLMSCAYEDIQTYMAVIIGTGSNASYVEKVRNIEKWQPDADETSDEMIINTEWGGLGDNGCIDFARGPADYIIDDRSLDKRRQIFEKMISGRYLGEVARLVLLEAVKANLLFHQPGRLVEAFTKEYGFLTKYLSEIESDTGKTHSKTRRILTELGVKDLTYDECSLVYKICRVISKRSAYLCAAGIAAVLNNMNRPEVTIGVDGSLVRCHPTFLDHMLQFTKKLINPGINIKMRLSEDGSGKGAALIAAVSIRKMH
ncbi:hypothetical protein HELRODRAFT_105497 [Helobdella robusta]|uniref:Phosphotransferase n=1 Tax=Helobdella robusta TaxID=6412 RepID=T1EDV8_HELRO|nr:hypothetical protein HELRODRAFT_105497 [Helobdella robusta]ESO12745.1 hypothetical protein HELRODRAFT_105497 [Helobdella robusta]